MQENKELEILLVEDSEADARLTVHTLRESPVQHNILWVKDGEQAIQALDKQGDFKNAPRPDVVLLDLNMPKSDGHKVLRKIKTNSALKSIPVFVLTSSTDNEDVEKTFLSWADTYFVKPLQLEEFDSTLKQLRLAKKGVEFSQF